MAVAARVVRRSLKEDKRLAAERRGEMDLRFAKWEVRYTPSYAYDETAIPNSTPTPRTSYLVLQQFKQYR
ncbi:unnamed protein product [Aureobasidium mustum]|uniref:Uncharacterized protein n=1 Tax=Aureobasidium mustum TaxID=2773714 RepID=A0A9N8PEZ3_9PEZI|nr:unnamed protein product [Aureobasidium mustum]